MKRVSSSQVFAAIQDACRVSEYENRPVRVGYAFRDEVLRSRRLGESLGGASRRVYRKYADA
jgi:hypothetical protein